VLSDFGINSEHCDLDILNKLCTVPQHWPIPEAYGGEIEKICTYRVHPGYARLIGDMYCEEKHTYAHLVHNSRQNSIVTNSLGPALQARYPKVFLEAVT